MDQKSTERIHSMDALRGIAMLLGVVTHATMSYTTIPMNGWPSDYHSHSRYVDFLFLYLHLFRMPLFFLVAGFFSRFLYLKIGRKAFIDHRFKRIVVPFLICLLTIRPLTQIPFSFYAYFTYQHATIPEAILKAVQDSFSWAGTFHLWFLYYLSIYYLGMLILLRAAKTQTGNRIFNYLSPIRKYNLYRFRNILLLCVPVFLLLIPFQTAEVGVATISIIPRMNYLAFYGFFFLAGFILNFQIKDLKKAEKTTWPGLVAGSLFSLMFFFLRDQKTFLMLDETGVLYLCKIFTALATILLTFGLLGFFMKYFSFESRTMRYVSDSSYWIYLIHLCFVVTLQDILAFTYFPLSIKLAIVIIIPTIISFISYQWFVRYTIIGKMLHGRRRKEPMPSVKDYFRRRLKYI